MPASLFGYNLLDCSNHIVEINDIIVCKQALPRRSGSRAKKTPLPRGTPGELAHRIMTSKYGYPRSKQGAGISLKLILKYSSLTLFFGFAFSSLVNENQLFCSWFFQALALSFGINRQNVHFSLFC